MSILDYLGLVSLREHNHAMERVRKQRDDETIRANNLSRLVSQLRADVTAAEMAYEESRKGQQRLAAELAALRPDAEKHRARVEKGMKNLKQFRAKV